MSHTPECKTCGARHFNFNPCPSRKGTLVMPGQQAWGSNPLPEGVLLNGAEPWREKNNVRHLPRVNNDPPPRAA